MRHLLRMILVAAILLCSTPCWGIIVFKKGQAEPIRGFLISENLARIEVHEPLPNGKIRKHILPRVSIDDIIQAVDAAQLNKLDPNVPEEYRSYAEDLAAKTEDPEARVTALRLYLIAAYLQPIKLGKSCLLGMAGLARSPAEERSFRAMAFSLDSDHDRALLKTPTMTKANADGVRAKDRQALSRGLRMVRTGRISEARRLFSRLSVYEAAGEYAYIISQEEYQTAIKAEGRLTPSLLKKFLTLELMLSEAPSTPLPVAETETIEVTPWSRLIARDELQTIVPQSLTGITEFDPRLSVYRDRKWQTPVEAK